MRTSRSGLVLRLPTVWVMPSWMAPFKADEVVWKQKWNRGKFLVLILIRPWPGSSDGESIVLTHQGFWVTIQSGHIQKSTNECRNKWNNKSMSLALPKINKKITINESEHSSKNSGGKSQKEHLKTTVLVVQTNPVSPPDALHCSLAWQRMEGPDDTE